MENINSVDTGNTEVVRDDVEIVAEKADISYQKDTDAVLSRDLLKDMDQVFAYIPKSWKDKLKKRECLYLYYLQETKDKGKSYHKCVGERGSLENARKNVTKFDRRVRVKAPLLYQQVIDYITHEDISVEAAGYKKALVDTGFVKKDAMAIARPDLTPAGQKKAITRIEGGLTAKDPNWRDKLTAKYDPEDSFDNLHDIAQGIGKGGALVSAETQRKANVDLLAFQNFTREETVEDAEVTDMRRRRNNVVNQILNITVNDVKEAKEILGGKDEPL